MTEERVEVFWSEEDCAWIAHYRGREEWKYVNAFGTTRGLALTSLAHVIQIIENGGDAALRKIERGGR